jgi:hypothetical protein
MKKCLRVPEE